MSDKPNKLGRAPTTPTSNTKSENNCINPDLCTQVQIRYICGHSSGGEFVKCARHLKTEEERCSNGAIIHVDGKISPHKCRKCLHSPI